MSRFVDSLAPARLGVGFVTGTVSIAVILVALLLLGTAEVFADNSSQTLLPMLVRRQDLAVASSRIHAGFITVNQLVGPAFVLGTRSVTVRHRAGSAA